MKKLSLKPDPWNEWIYNCDDERYNSPEAVDLRERRKRAIEKSPQWMIDMAIFNDECDKWVKR